MNLAFSPWLDTWLNCVIDVRFESRFFKKNAGHDFVGYLLFSSPMNCTSWGPLCCHVLAWVLCHLAEQVQTLTPTRCARVQTLLILGMIFKQAGFFHPSTDAKFLSRNWNQWPASDSDASSFWSTRVTQLAFLENLFNVFLAAPDQWRSKGKNPANLPNLHLTIASRFVSNSRQFEGRCAFMTYSQVLMWILNNRTID